MVRGLLCGLAGGVVGAVVWCGATLMTGLEVGWVAWGVGLIVGSGVALGWAGTRSHGTAVLAVVIAAASIALGKYGVSHVAVHNHIDRLQNDDLTDAEGLAALRDDVADSWREHGREATSMRRKDARLIDGHPKEIVEEAEGVWIRMTELEQARFKQRVRDDRVAALEAARVDRANEAFLASLGPIDIVWIVLALVTAYRIAQPRHDEALRAELQQQDTSSGMGNPMARYMPTTGAGPGAEQAQGGQPVDDRVAAMQIRSAMRRAA
jgi:hypothetical protein